MTQDTRGPRLSVLCITPDTFATLTPLFSALLAQTIARELEIVLIAPAAAITEPLPFPSDAFNIVTRATGAPDVILPRSAGVS